MNNDLDILLAELPCLVINKPGGVLTQAPPGIDSMEMRVKKWAAEHGEKGAKQYVGVVHRLDRPASGCMLFCLDHAATKKMGEQFEKRVVKKTYWAIVAGKPKDQAATWTDFMRKIPDVPQSEIVPEEHPDSQFAMLRYQVMDSCESCSWLEIELETGRTHQIRLQTSSRTHPILGDEQYGSQIPFGEQTTDLRDRWIALHARSLKFEHPVTKKMVRVEAPLPKAWRDWQDKLTRLQNEK